MISRHSLVLSALLLSSCAPTNPFDPNAPVELQAKARIVGHLKGDVHASPAFLTLLDRGGQPIRDANGGAVTQFPTLAVDAPLPQGLEAVAGLPYAIEGLVPGTYTVLFNAAVNNEPLLLDAQSSPATVVAGATAVLDLSANKRDINDVGGAVRGAVDGAEGGATFVVRLVSKDGNPDLEQLAILSDNGSFSFRHVPAGEYKVAAAGDSYAPATTKLFAVADTEVVLPEPLHLTTLGRVFVVDDFAGHDGFPPFAPFLASSPVHVAVAPLVLTDPNLVPFARVYTDDTRPGPEDGWVALGGGGSDVLPADFDTTAGDGPRTVLAQLRLCSGACTCAAVDGNGACTDPEFQPPLLSREIPLDVVFDATAPRAVTVSVDDVVRTVFPADLEGAPGIVPINCARFGDAECATAADTATTPDLAGDLVDDTSRVHGFFVTLDDPAAPTQFTALGTLGQLARIQGGAPVVQRAGPAQHTLRVWAEDAAGNVGLVDVRTLLIDVAGVDLASPALVVTAGTVSRGADVLVPGPNVTVDVAVRPASGGGAGEKPARWQVHNQGGTATARGLVVDQQIPYTGPQQIDVDGAHLDSLDLLVDAFDGVGNLTRTSVPLLLKLSRTSDVTGAVVLENRADAAGASVALVNSAGTTLVTAVAGAGTVNVDVGNPDPLTATFALDGSYAFSGVPVSSTAGVPSEVYTIIATGPAPFATGRTAVEVKPPGPSLASTITLLLPRGSLVGRFVLEGREALLTNSGIQVTLVNPLGDDVGAALTFANGVWRITNVPVGAGYKAVGFFDGFIQQEVPGIEVLGDVDSIVLDDGTGTSTPTPVVLNALSGDFRLCDLGPKLDLTCSPIQFSNQTQLQVGGVSFDGIGRFRVSTTPFLAGDANPPFQNVVAVPPSDFAAPRVDLGPAEGNITVFLQLESSSGISGSVLHSGIVFDRTPPQNVTATLARGAGALADGFTNESVGRVTVHAEAGSGSVAPLKEARVVFAAAAPASVPAQQACAHDVSCAVPFDNTAEGAHTAFAFSCDQAGNCTQTAVSAVIVVDRTAPSLANGASFAPKADYIVQSGGQLFTRSAQFDIAVQTGRAKDAGGVDVRDVSGALVADVFGSKFGLSAVVDDGTFRAIPAPTPTHDTERLVPGVALPPVDGTYTIFAQLTDAAGNTSSVANNPFHVDLVLDTRGPTLTFELNGGDDFTRAPNVSLDINDQSIDPTVTGQFNLDGVFLDNDPTTFDERALPLLSTSFSLAAPPPPAGDGRYTVFARFFDRAGNLTERNASIFLDRTPPDVLLVDCASCTTSAAAPGALFSNNAATHQIVIDTLAIDNSGAVDRVRSTVHLGAQTGVPLELPFSGTQTVTLSVLNGAGAPISPDGTYRVDVVFIDQAGNETAPQPVTVTLDTAAPAPALAINGAVGASAQFTNNENVTLAISGGASLAPIAGIRVQNTTSAFAGAQQALVTSLQFQLANAGVDESKLVFLEATDAAGNVGVASQSINLDKTKPTGTVTLAAGATRTNATTVNVAFAFTLTDVAAFAVTSADAGFPADCGAGVVFTNGVGFPSQVTFAGTTGGTPEVRMVSVCTKDRAGNTALAFDTIVLDQEVPAGAVTINGGAAFTTSRAITAAIAAPPDTAQVKTSLAGPGAAAALDCLNATGYGAVPNPPTASFTIPGAGAAGAGLYTVQVCLKDSAGNVSRDVNGAAAAVSDTIIFDAAAPTISVLLNGGDAFTTSSTGTVNVAITASDDLSAPLGGITSMRVANTVAVFSGAGEPFTTVRTQTVAATTTEGSKTVCVEVTDAAGRVSSACDDIVLDLTGAPGTVAIARASGNFSTDADAALSTTFRSADPTIASVAFAQAPLDCASVAAASFVALAVNTDLVRDVNVAGGEGTRAVTGCFKSQSGLLTSTTDTVFVDPIDPPLAQPLAPGPVSSSGNGTLVSTRTPTFQWGAVNGASSFTVLVRRVSDGVNVLTQAGLTGLSFAPAAGQALPEVPLEWIVVAVKPSGRSSAVSFVGAARLTPDATLPTAPSALTVAVHAPGRALVTTPAPCTATKPCVNDPFPTLSFTPGTDAGTGVSQIVELTLNGDFTSPLLTLTRVNGAAFDIPNGLEDGSYRWRVRAVDGAGNQTISATSDFLVDRTPPLPPTIVPPPDPVSQTVTSPLVINWSNELSSGALTYKFDITTDVLGFGAPLTPPSTVTAATSVDVTGRLVNGAGVRHIVRVASIDALGNQSAFTTATFIHDSAAPCATSSSVAIVGSDPAGDFTDSSVVTVGVTCVGPAGDNPSTMKVACDGVLDNEPKIGFAPTTTCVLNPGQGLRTVVVKIFDAAGNATGNLTDTVTVDTSSPTTPILATADTVTRLVTFPIAIASGSIDANFDHHEFLDGVNNAQFTTFNGSSFNVVFNNTAAQPNQLYNVRVRGVDKAGNASAEAIVKITFDGQAPTTPAILGNDVVHFVNADTFTFTLAVGSDDVSFASYQTAQCAGTGCTVSAGSFTDNPGNGTFTFTLPQDQATTFAVRGRDKAGNVSGVSTIDVVEDSHNPRPVALQRLPEKSLAGAPFASAKVLGPYVDVFFARTETNITPPGIDPNFDHFEVRAETAAFQGFVPMCDVPTPSCPVPFITDGGQTVDQSKLLIKLNNTIVGFRVPVVKNQSNTITLRSVDKAGNVSIETTTSTTEIGVQTVTTDGHASFAPFIFGDKIAFIDAIAGNVLRVKELGNDQLWGTADDGNTAIDSGVNTEGAQFNFQSTRAIAMGPNLVFWDKVVGGVNRVQMMASGNDGSFAGAADNSAIQNASSDGGGVVVDESKAQGEPSFWRDRLAWRQSTAATETDVMVRQAGANGIFGDGDDVFAKIGAPLSHRLFPVVSGDNLAFLLCADKNPASCPGAVPLQLVVVNSGVDRVFGTGDDVTTTLTQATEITAMRPELYTPGTTGRAACRNVVAYGGIGGHRGIQVIATEPDGTFTANDTPVGISQFDGFSGALRSFSLYDTIATSNDQNSGPSTEIDFAGPDGCFTRSADNLAFDGGVAGDVGAVGWNSLVVEVQQPQLHLAYVEYGAERAVWPRPEGTPDFALNLESDRQGFATGSGAYDFTTRTMRTPTLGTGAFNKDVLFERYWAYAADGSGASPTLEDLFVRDRGVDEIMGSADDVERRVTTAHRMFENRDQRAPFGRTFDVDENAVAFAAQRSADTQIIPVVRSAGVDGVLGTGDDCEIETNAAPDPNGYTQVHLARGRIGFQACADPGCFLTFGPVFVREVATGSDPCTGAALPVTTVSAGATLPHLDGERVAFIDASRPAIVDAGLDHRFASQSDNVLTRLFVPNGNNIAQALAISGDRVVWIDQRTGVDRVVVGDLGDLSERVLTRSAEADSTVTIDGDVLTYGSHVPGSFATDSAALYYFGVQPDLPNDFVNNGPTRLRCPTDDIYEENDSQVTATPINSGAAVNAIVCKNDPDRYAVNAGAGCSVHAHAHFVNADGDVDMDVLQPDNTVLTSSAGVQNDERIDVATGGVAGLWQVQVRGFNGAENTYDLTVNVTCP